MELYYAIKRNKKQMINSTERCQVQENSCSIVKGEQLEKTLERNFKSRGG